MTNDQNIKKAEPFNQKHDVSKGFVVRVNKKEGLSAGEYVLNGSLTFEEKIIK